MNTASSFCIIIGFIGSSDIRRMILGLPTARNLWRKSLMKYGLWPEIIIFNENLDWKCARVPRFWEGVFLDRLTGSKSKLESWTKSLTRFFSVFSVCSVDFLGGGCFARNLWRKSLMKYGLWPEIIIFNENPDWKCARIPRFWEGFLWGSHRRCSKSKLESWTKSLTKMKSEVWGLKSEVCHPTIILKIISNL